MILLNLSNVNKTFDEEILFENVSFDINGNDKIGLVGVNGAGKTTLFKMLTGKIKIEEGKVFKNKLANIGYMEQHVCNNSQNSVYEELLFIFSPLIEMEKEIEEIVTDIESKNGDIDSLVKRQHKLTEEYERTGGFLYRGRAKATLFGLGFSEAEFNMPVNTLSGGQKTRILLGKMLLSDANLLLLDEPTNHLDIKSVEWLEDYLKTYHGAVITISHDRYFLDKIANRIFEIENKKFIVYNGNYTYYLKKKTEDKVIAEKHYETTQKEIKRIESIIEQQRRWNREKNIKTAESKQKVVDRLEKTLEKPASSLDNINFKFNTKSGGGNDVLIINELKKSFGHKLLFENLNIHIRKGERIFLLGPNGCGKTTLFKIIRDLCESNSGTCKLGINIETGYYDQTQSDLNYDKTAIDEISDAYPHITLTKIRNALATFLFKGDDVFKEISMLSGGERARVALLKLMLSPSNFLLLDEPTNHLDIISREALEEALTQYEGTLFIVSHDRYFINKMADRIYRMTKDGVTEYIGNYDYYVEKCKDEEVIVKKEAPKENEYKVKKEKESVMRRLQGQISRAEQNISETEEIINKLEEQLHSPECSSDYVRAIKLTNGIENLRTKLEGLYEEWDELQK